jgi:Na+-translocating ferredoxin:NAD+ oxidoreductase RnfD subunit
VVYAGASARVGKNNTMENIEIKQSKYLVSMAPFSHVKEGLRRLWLDLIIGYIPVSLSCMVTNIKLVYILIASFLGFILAAITSKHMYSGGNYYKLSLRKHVLCALVMVILLTPQASIRIVFLSALAAGLLDEFVLGVKGRSFMPPFLISWMFFSGIQNTAVINYTACFPVAAGLGAVYLIIRRWISLYTLAGITCAYLYGLIYMKDISSCQLISLMLIALLILSYPGVIPKGNNARFIYAVICGVLILNFGLWGVVIAMLLTGIVDKLIKK